MGPSSWKALTAGANMEPNVVSVVNDMNDSLVLAIEDIIGARNRGGPIPTDNNDGGQNNNLNLLAE
jgi:hypothetical protein